MKKEKGDSKGAQPLWRGSGGVPQISQHTPQEWGAGGMMKIQKVALSDNAEAG